MQQRKPTIGNGRPSGTDGSDFSYRMVVDSRYTKVAKGKSRLSSLIFIQVIVQLVGLLNFLLSILKEESLDTLAVSSIVISFLSLLIGELGRRRSRVNFLKFFMFASSMAVLISIAGAARSNVLVEMFCRVLNQIKHLRMLWSSDNLVWFGYPRYKSVGSKQI
ncbi:protein jagunal homolog 1 isoform X2 [Camellia sinensis]|uniref:protein jagunal homolog 1 isoform X2 n=1 Tax=Camellia sinensis TaxID=4442 RepID=UPI0010355E92|nr:protein jagunal homolog 1 isoform X2 [Camellia sinensis]